MAATLPNNYNSSGTELHRSIIIGSTSRSVCDPKGYIFQVSRHGESLLRFPCMVSHC